MGLSPRLVARFLFAIFLTFVGVSAQAQSLGGQTLSPVAQPLPLGAQPTTLTGTPGALPPREQPSIPTLSKQLANGRTTVLAWKAPGAASRDVITSWYELREWNSLVPGAVCGTDRFQTAIRARAAAAKQATDAMPQGFKAILVFWELTPHWDHPADYVRNAAGVVQGFTDERGVFQPYISPWWDAGAVESRCRIESFFQEFRRLGGHVDYVVLDIERRMVNWALDLIARDRYGANSSRFGQAVAESRRLAYYRAIESDPRMDRVDPRDLGFTRTTSLRAQLSQGSLTDHVAKWWYQEVKTGPNRFAYLQWNKLMADRAATYVNYALTEPIRQIFPKIKMSDYDNQFTSVEHNLPDGYGHRVSMFPIEVIAGNIQSRPMYGTLPSQAYYYVQAPFLRYEGTPFNALRHNLNFLRSGVLSRSHVPFQGWIAPKGWGEAHGYVSVRLTNNPMYEEMLYHILLSTTEPLLFWNPSVVATTQDEAAVVAAVNEYDAVMGYANRRTPRVSALIDWQTDHVISSEETDSAMIYRFTPNLPAGQQVTSLIRSHQPASLVTPSGRPLSFGPGSFIRTTPGSAGVWVVVPKSISLSPSAGRPGSLKPTAPVPNVSKVSIGKEVVPE